MDSYPVSAEALRVMFTVYRCEYEGRPADVKTLIALTGFSKTMVLGCLKELEESISSFRPAKDPKDARRSLQKLKGPESPYMKSLFTEIYKITDKLAAARKSARELYATAAVLMLGFLTSIPELWHTGLGDMVDFVV
jgi:hypothetical protein